MIELVQHKLTVYTQVGRVGQRYGGGSESITTGPRCRILRPSRILHISRRHTDGGPKTAARIESGEIQERSVGPGSAQCDVRLAVEDNARRQVIRTRIQENDLTTRTVLNRRVDLRSGYTR